MFLTFFPLPMSETTSPELATLAGKVLNGYQPTPEEIKSLAACVLTQVEDQILVKKPEMQRIKIVDYDPQGSVPDGVDTMIKPVSD